MSTPTNELPVAPQMPTDVPTLQNILKNTVAKLMAHSQTVQELIKANMDLRAMLHVVQNDKGQLEAYVKSLLAPPAATTAETAATVENGAVADDTVPVAPTSDAANEPATTDADPVSA